MRVRNDYRTLEMQSNHANLRRKPKQRREWGKKYSVSEIMNRSKNLLSGILVGSMFE